jgi:hypothetical protein
MVKSPNETLDFLIDDSDTLDLAGILSRLKLARAYLGALILRSERKELTRNEYNERMGRVLNTLRVNRKKDSKYSSSSIQILCSSENLTNQRRVSLSNAALHVPEDPKKNGVAVVRGVIGTYQILFDPEHRFF